MGRKNVLKTFDMSAPTDDNPTNGDMSAPFVSTVVNVINLDKASLHVHWDGAAPDGEIVVDARNGEHDTWYTLDFGTMLISGNTGDHQLVFNELPFTDIRLQYGFNSGTGTMTARLSAKVTGA